MEVEDPTPVATEQPARTTERRRRLRMILGTMLVVVALGLVPWTLYLAVTLPDRHHAAHWSAVWVGFDIVLALAILATAIGAFRRARWIAIAATITGTMLICDAWFDVLTSDTGSQATVAVVSAAFAELPLAALCFWIAWNVEKAREWRDLLSDQTSRAAAP